MKTKFFPICLLASTTLVANAGIGFAQTTQHHFFIHGYSASPSQMTNISNDMKTRFGWTETPTLPGYDSFFGTDIPGGDIAPSTGIHAQLYSSHSDGKYIGLGYSCGGLFTRTEAKNYGTTFVQGLVTLQTPNLGVYMADYGHRSAFLSQYAKEDGQVLRVDISFLGGVVGALGATLLQVANLYGSSALAGIANDMAPGCSYLTTLNLTQPPIPRVAMYAQVPWPFMFSYQDENNGLTNYNNTINGLRGQSHNWDSKANSEQSSIHWYSFYKWPVVWYDRSRAGDYTAAANAYPDEENSWEDATAGRYHTRTPDFSEANVSDGLIAIWSASGIASPTAVSQVCTCNINHGGEVAPGADYGSRTNVYNALYTAGAR